jgi:hypothetical protein
VRFVVDKVTLGQVFLQVLCFSPCQYYSTSALHSCSTRCSYQDIWAKPGKLPESSVLSEIEEH